MVTFGEMADKYLTGEERARYSEEMGRGRSFTEDQQYHLNDFHEIEFLKASFVWNDSKYGFVYWDKVYRDLEGYADVI